MNGPRWSGPSRAARRLALVAAVAGAVALIGFFVDPRRAWSGWLLGFLFLTELAISGTLFLALLTVAGARWADALRPVAVAMGASLPVACIAGLILLVGVPTLYEWAHGAAADELLARKRAWLNMPAFALRLIGIFSAWFLFTRLLRRGRGAGLPLAAGFVATFAVTWSVASVDWVQSLEPHWSSTIFALRTATGLVVSGLAAATILVVSLRERGVLRGLVTEDHLHDLGRLLLVFPILWIYVWYCQYMLVWYCDLPEEAIYFARRSTAGWRAVTSASLVLGFVVPFLVLLFRRARRSGPVLVRVAFVLLAGQALDLFALVGPGTVGPSAEPGVFGFAGIVAALAASFALSIRELGRSGSAATLHRAGDGATAGSLEGSQRW